MKELEGYVDKRKGNKKGKGEEANFASADGQPLPVKQPRSTLHQLCPAINLTPLPQEA